MPYYCKKCGAVVSGKFCSCCGTRATSDLTDFRRDQRRAKRLFIDRMSAGDRSGFARHAAEFAWLSAEHAILWSLSLSVDNFSTHSDIAYQRLIVVNEKAEVIYRHTMSAACAVLNQ